MRRLGAMPYMTPLQMATESSATPKSVMKTTVGGGSTAACCARSGLAARNSKTNHKQNIRADFFAGADVIRIKLDSPKRASSLLERVSYMVLQEGIQIPSGAKAPI